MKPMFWSKKQAREYVVKYQMINLKKPLKSYDAIKFIFDRLETIQYDPLDCVGRNSDLVLQSRIIGYKKEYLHHALYNERFLVDGWDKQMSIFKAKDFPKLALIRKERQSASLASFVHHDIQEALDYQEEIKELIKTKGPLYSREINIDSRWKNGKMSSITLDYLFNTGQIVVYNKTKAQKQFELTERVFDYVDEYMEESDFIYWYLKRRIKTLGFFWNRGIAWQGLHISKKSIRTKYLKKLLEEEYIVKILVEDIKEPFYAIKEFIDNPVELSKKISFIAPLDSINWDRDLLKLIFNFDYKWEVYVPASKRIYGYYVLPILYGSEFVGRIEFENHRINRALVVKNVWFEDSVKKTKVLEKALEKELNNFSKYLNASEVIYQNK
ncbi:MAG: YcaQ family DNA glycosylase [Tenericutes bacterium]|nr:YcaQ family DNA glycosylase [Mycoplasmatota bacterium]